MMMMMMIMMMMMMMMMMVKFVNTFLAPSGPQGKGM